MEQRIRALELKLRRQRHGLRADPDLAVAVFSGKQPAVRHILLRSHPFSGEFLPLYKRTDSGIELWFAVPPGVLGSLLGVHAPFYCAVILLPDIVQVLHWSVPTRAA